MNFEFAMLLLIAILRKKGRLKKGCMMLKEPVLDESFLFKCPEFYKWPIKSRSNCQMGFLALRSWSNNVSLFTLLQNLQGQFLQRKLNVETNL